MNSVPNQSRGPASVACENTGYSANTGHSPKAGYAPKSRQTRGSSRSPVDKSPLRTRKTSLDGLYGRDGDENIGFKSGGVGVAPMSGGTTSEVCEARRRRTESMNSSTETLLPSSAGFGGDEHYYPNVPPPPPSSSPPRNLPLNPARRSARGHSDSPTTPTTPTSSVACDIDFNAKVSCTFLLSSHVN